MLAETRLTDEELARVSPSAHRTTVAIMLVIARFGHSRQVVPIGIRFQAGVLMMSVAGLASLSIRR